jgi:tryptophan halogenase
MEKKELVVVGGGTAGWLTALYAKTIFPEHSVSVIESSKIGILGAGEASTPILVSVFDFLKIPTSDIIKKTKATIKNTAKFSNWAKDGSYFYHPFEYLDKNISEQYYPDSRNLFYELDTNKYHIYASLLEDEMSDYCLINKICDNNKVPFVKNQRVSENIIGHFDQVSNWSLNFDASLLANYLQEVAKERGIQHYDGIVNKINVDADDKIVSLTLDDNRDIPSHFVFDCTGFDRLVVGKFYKSTWKSYGEFLPTKKAIPFFLDTDNDLFPYIEARAMDYGWMWKTPLQHRYGCGYAFDSDQISEDDAKKEIDDILGFEVFSPKTFSFEPGVYESVWIKNAMAVGLSAGFVEPLEATAIMQTVFQLSRFFSDKNNIETNDIFTKNRFNAIYVKESEEILDYIYLHYVTDKENTKFWKNFTKHNKVPEFVQYVFDTIKRRPLSLSLDFYEQGRTTFMLDDYLYVLFGHKLITKDLCEKYLSTVTWSKLEDYSTIKNNQDIIVNMCVDHKEFLDYLKG